MLVSSVAFFLLMPMVVISVAPAESPLVLPPIKYLPDQSFRGLSSGGVVQNYDVSGHAIALPGVHDFLRLVPPAPLAYGSIFSRLPMKKKDWVVDVAFRFHGASNEMETSDDPAVKGKMSNKGGRGLGFWYTKKLPGGPVTISSDPTKKVAQSPPFLPRTNDPADPEVSFFGYKTKFDGLGVLFDASPSAPIHRRSDPINYGSEQAHGAETQGVISGVLDDGQKTWLDPEDAVKVAGKDAAYLASAAGECAGLFRNAAGLLWVRISHYNNTIRCDLDLTPHTTLSAAGRDFAHHCWSIPDVHLDAGSYFGVSGLASGSTEPDAIDLYAIDVFEVLPAGVVATDDTGEPDVDLKNVLEGTAVDTSANLAHEIFLSQAHMMEAVDGLARRIDALATKVTDMQTPFTAVMNRLMGIEAQIAAMGGVSGIPPSQIPAPVAQALVAPTQSLEHVIQLHERLMAELTAQGRKIDVSNTQTLGTAGVLLTRTAELLLISKAMTATLDDNLPISLPWFWIILLSALYGIYLIVQRSRSEYGWRGRGKKMI